MPRSAASAEQNRQRMRERYRERLEGRQCLKCKAGLTDDDLTLCVECKAQADESAARYAASPKRAAKARAWSKKRYHANLEASRAQQNGYRAKRQQDGRCLYCRSDALDGSNYCQKHQDATRKSSRDNQRRRRLRPASNVFRAIAQAAKFNGAINIFKVIAAVSAIATSSPQTGRRQGKEP